jgi:carboxyl-terminal processing protease
VPQRNLIVIFLAAIISLVCHQKAPDSRYVRTLSHAMGLIEGLYVEDVQSRALFEDAMQGMVGGLDQYSAFIGSKSFQQFQESLGQEFGGIGIMVEGPPRTERLTVLTPVFNTPAYHAGMQSGDVILEVDGVDTEGMTLEDAVNLMRGPRGKEVELVVQSRGATEPHTLRLKRDIIPIESVLGDKHEPDGSWNYVLEENPNLGYIRVTSFGEHTAADLAKALKQCGDIQGLILDLRGNAGGLLNSAVETCDMFISQGEIVSTRGRGGVVRQRFEAKPKVLLPADVPMVVLINRGSASASEIVAACLKDHGRATVIGQRSWGKGTVQNIIELEGGRSALKLTTASYWRPNGHNIHRLKDAKEEDEWGVRPEEGFDVPISDDDLRLLSQHRRQRDVVPGKLDGPRPEASDAMPPVEPQAGQGGETDTDAADGQGKEESLEPLDDPQLRKAIELLESKIRDAQPSAARA